ncbi:MAG: 3-deoxy-D-manno-octulosonic acid transferase, partial [Rhodospirillales bacterium]
MIALYRLFIRLCWPLFARHLQNRLTAGKEDPKRFPERLGQSNRRRPDGVHLVWIHGASVGEAVSALPLVQALLSLRDDLFVLVTTGTVTSARLLEQRLPGRALHQFVPVDHPDCIRRFLDRWKPDLAIWMESEFWPNLILET